MSMRGVPLDERTVAKSIPAFPRAAAVAVAPRDEAAPELPEAGGRFLDFSLIEEIGSGSFGRVFLAAQGELADRLVALKITVGRNDEPMKLARLQHTAIMPVYSSHQDGRLQAVCMPFFGRATLADFCRSLRPEAALPRSGDYLRSTLRSRRPSTEERASGVPDFVDQRRPKANDTPAPLAALAALGYVEAVLLTAMRIAEGLDHAHQRGLVHQDLKPANVLVTDEGLPMILDFNLARDTDPKAGLSRAVLGGTIAYMSPEQLMRFDGDPAAAEIDHRSDIHSLGLILYRLLTGRSAYDGPAEQAPDLGEMVRRRRSPPPPLRERNPDVSPAVESIVRKCLAFRPEDRYRTAADLAEDLHRHLNHLPLRHAPEPSLRERLGKWCRRHPTLTSPAVLLAVVAAVTLVGVASAARLRADAEARAHQAAYREARSSALRFDALRAEAELLLASHDDAAGRRKVAVEKGTAALDVLGLGGGDAARLAPLPEEERAALDAAGGELARLMLRSSLMDSDTYRLPDEVRRRLRAVVAADAVRPPKGTTDRRAYVYACDLQAEGKYRESLDYLEPYNRANPGDAAGWFLRGRASDRLERLREAQEAYSACVALKPAFPAGYFNRALIAERRGALAGALADFTAALEIAADLDEARLERAIVRYRLGKFAEARADIDIVLGGKTQRVRALFVRANVREKQGDKAGAAADRALAMKTRATDALSLVAQGNARPATEAKQALEDYRAAERLAPDAVAPLQNQANTLAENLGDFAGAVAALDRLLTKHPDYVPARCGRAVYLARAGKLDEAVREARAVLASSDNPFTQYRAACALSIVSAKRPKHKAEAICLIAKALESGEGYEYLADDSDLDPLRKDAGFARLVELVKTVRSLQAAPAH